MAAPQPFEQFVTEQLIAMASGMAELKGKVAGVGMIAEQTLQQATKTNGRMNEAEGRLDALEGVNHDEALVAQARKDQVDEVKQRAFGLISALDNKLVTTLVLIGLVGVGWFGQVVWPW